MEKENKPSQYWQADDQQNSDQQPSQYDGYDLATSSADEGQKRRHDANAVNASVSWQASEYVHHHKEPVWFVGLGAGALVLIGIAVWLQAWTFVALILVMAVAIVVFAVRPPRSLSYTLSPSGLQIDDQIYDYHQFRAFGVVQDGGLYSIMLIPAKRFMPAISIYFAQDDGEKIVDILGAHLPMEQLKQDPIDRLMRNLRF